jgi:hypothetical protein
MRKIPIAVFFILLIAGTLRAEILDQQKIHSLYADGEFEKLVAEVSGFESRNKTYSHSDSAFIAKYLAVVYAANPETREKAKYYMYQLLKLQPEAQLMGMYANEEIEKLFDRMKKEYHVTYDSSASAPASAARPETLKPDTVGRAIAPAPATPSTMLAPEAPREPREKRYRWGVIGMIAGPLGKFAVADTVEGQSATAGLGLGGEFVWRLTPHWHWATSLSVLIQPRNLSQYEELKNTQFAGANFTEQGGHYINFPLLTGLEYHRAIGERWGWFGVAQIGITTSGISDEKETEAGSGDAHFDRTFDEDRAFAFALGGGATLGRHWQVALRFLDLGRPRFKGHLSGVFSGSPVTPEVFYVSPRQISLALSGGYRF